MTNRIKNFLRAIFLKRLDKTKVEKVLNFYQKYQGFRLTSECSKVTGIDKSECETIKYFLYKQNLLGMYFFEKGMPPHKYMREAILKKFPEITPDSIILEIGPGANPVFSSKVYLNWYGIDKNLSEQGMINFRENEWLNPNYSSGRMINGSWENLSDSVNNLDMLGKFDLVVASHSYEHVFKPIQALKEAARALRPNGVIVLFVPNGYSDEPAARNEMTHTLYLVPEMIKEFFDCCGCFKDLTIDDFRPNYDFMITARLK